MKQFQKSAFELIEESVHLLRRAPAGTLAIYYLGSLPFVLALLFFWADMSRDPFAARRLAGASLGLAGLFLWMKACQAVFARHLRAVAAGRPTPFFTVRQCLRILVAQAAWQPTGLFVLPLALGLVFPFGWTYAFYQNLTALPEAEGAGPWRLGRAAAKQAGFAAKQNHLALLVLLAFGFFVFLNWCTVGLMLPALLKMLFGMETMFTRSSSSLLNTTFFAVTAGLTYLCVDPIVKGLYTLRCFYGESRTSGEDLKADLKPFALAQTAALWLLLGTLATASASRATASPAATAVAESSTSPEQLDRKIDEVLRQRKYTWRMPREKIVDEQQQGPVGRFMARVSQWIRERLRAARDWFEQWMEKWFKNRRPSNPGGGSGYSWMVLVQLLLYTLIAAAVACLAWLLYQALWKRKKSVAIASQAVQPAPDLADENVGAEQLPEDGWTQLGRELLARGELRLAMRAFYLASLAHLAGRNLITLAKFKSNHDYERELRRRGHTFPELVGLFGDNVSIFDRTWYGMHEISEAVIGEFIARVEQLRNGPKGTTA